MAGIDACLMSHILTNDWIIDSSATNHIEATEKLLNDDPKAKKPYKDKVHLPIGDKVRISC